MNTPQNLISSETARLILFEAEKSGTTVENYLQEIAKESNGNSKNRISSVRKAKITVDFARANEWLKNHRLEYVGKWIVLDGDRLVGFGDNPVPLVEKARAEGAKVPFVKFITEESEPFMGGWL